MHRACYANGCETVFGIEERIEYALPRFKLGATGKTGGAFGEHWNDRGESKATGEESRSSRW